MQILLISLVSLFVLGGIKLWKTWKKFQHDVDRLKNVPGLVEIIPGVIAEDLPLSDSVKQVLVGHGDVMKMPLHEDAQYFPSEIEELCPHGPGSIKQVWWGSMFALRRRFGPYYKVVSPMLGSIIFVHDPLFIEDIVVKQSPKLVDKGSDFNLAMHDLFLAHNVFTSNHAAWKKQRVALNQAFSDDAMMRVSEVSLEISHRMFNTIDAAESAMDTRVLATSSALDVIGLAGFGFDFSKHKKERDAVVRLVDKVVNALSLPLLIQRLLQKITSIRGDSQSFKNMILGIILAERSKEDSSKTLILLLLKLDELGALSENEIIANAFILIAAGHETTAMAISVILHLLASHPEIQLKAHDEISKLGLLPGELPSMKHYNTGQLDFFKNIMFEALRLYPSALGLGRVATSDFTYKGVPFATGDLVIIASPCIHRDARVWGSNANEFIPDRWNDISQSDMRFNYLPWGIGARQCIGTRFSLVEIVELVAALLTRYNLTLGDGMPENLNLIMEAPFTSHIDRPMLIKFTKK